MLPSSRFAVECERNRHETSQQLASGYVLSHGRREDGSQPFCRRCVAPRLASSCLFLAEHHHRDIDAAGAAVMATVFSPVCSNSTSGRAASGPARPTMITVEDSPAGG